MAGVYGQGKGSGVADRVACVTCGLVKEGSFSISLSTVEELNRTCDCCSLPNYIFYKGLGYQYKEEFKKKIRERNPEGRIA